MHNSHTNQVPAFYIQAGSVHRKSISQGKQAKGARQSPRKPIRVQKKTKKTNTQEGKQEEKTAGTLVTKTNWQRGQGAHRLNRPGEGRPRGTGATHWGGAANHTGGELDRK